MLPDEDSLIRTAEPLSQLNHQNAPLGGAEPAIGPWPSNKIWKIKQLDCCDGWNCL